MKSRPLFNKRPHRVEEGRFGASQAAGGILNPECEEILKDFQRFNTEDARAAFADRWVRLTAGRLDTTWVVLYHLLSLIRDRELYKMAEFMEDKKPYDSFEDYWTKVVQKPFATWMELEKTYHFVQRHAPELMGHNLPEVNQARTNAEKVTAAAQATTGEILPKGNRTGKNQYEMSGNTTEETGKLPVSSETQPSRAIRNGIGERTQRKLDRLARDFPDLHDQIKEGSLSVHRACVIAGISTDVISVPNDPKKAAQKLAKHFSGDSLDVLIRALQEIHQQSGY